MLKNKMLQWLIMILIAITLIALASFILWEYLDRRAPAGAPGQAAVDLVEPKKMTAKQMKEATVELKEITTNLAGNSFIRISFAFLLENAKAKEEFDLLSTRVRAIIIQTLADLPADQASGSKGQDMISTELINKINPILTKGKLVRVDITDFHIGRAN